MPAKEHGSGGEGAADVAEGIAGVAEAEPVALPLGVLLGVVHEFECHELPPLAVEDDDGVIITREEDERGKKWFGQLNIHFCKMFHKSAMNEDITFSDSM